MSEVEETFEVQASLLVGAQQKLPRLSSQQSMLCPDPASGLGTMPWVLG